MDVLAHGLWTNLMYKALPVTRNNRRITLWGVFFGVLPDFISFTPIFVLFFYQLLSGRIEAPNGRPDIDTFPLAGFTSQMYDYTHSLIIFLVVTGIVWLIRKQFPWALLGWGLHVGLDIISHSREFYPTPFLFPVSDLNVNGIPWAHPVFMAINYGLLLILYLWLIPRVRNIFLRNKKPPQI
jgi:hypothetical protein